MKNWLGRYTYFSGEVISDALGKEGKIGQILA